MKNDEIEKLQFGHWPMPESFLTELGRVVVIWSALENLLDIVLTKLAGIDIYDPRGVILFTHLSMPQKLDTLGALGEQLAPNHPNLNDLPESIAKIRTAQKLRNDLVHNALTYSDEDGQLEMPVGSARGKLKAEVRKVSLVDIKRVVVEISTAQKHLYKVVFKRENPHPWETSL